VCAQTSSTCPFLFVLVILIISLLICFTRVLCSSEAGGSLCVQIPCVCINRLVIYLFIVCYLFPFIFIINYHRNVISFPSLSSSYTDISSHGHTLIYSYTDRLYDMNAERKITRDPFEHVTHTYLKKKLF